MHSSVTLPSLLILQYLCAQTHTRRTMMKNKSPRQANRKARYAAAHQNWPRPSPAVLCVRSSSLRVRKRCFSASPRSRFRILKVKEPVPVRRTAKKGKGTLLVPGAVTEHAKAKTQETQHQSTKSGAVHTHTHARKQCFNTRKQQHQNSRSTKPPRPLSPFLFPLLPLPPFLRLLLPSPYRFTSSLCIFWEPLDSGAFLHADTPAALSSPHNIRFPARPSFQGEGMARSGRVSSPHTPSPPGRGSGLAAFPELPAFPRKPRASG